MLVCLRSAGVADADGKLDGIDFEDARTRLERDGYVILPQLFTPDEVERLRGSVSGFFERGGVIFQLGRTQPNAAIECHDIGWLFSDPRVVGVFQKLYGARDVMFTGHCDIHQDAFSQWHKDTGKDDGYFDEDCFVPDCRVFKMAIYLQDHANGDGMTLMPGTHHNRAWGRTEAGAAALRSKPGDAVLFDVRIDHRGRLPTTVETVLHFASRGIKRVFGTVIPSLRRPGDVKAMYDANRAWAKLTGQAQRMSVFFTFAAPDRFGRQFARTNMDRQLKQYVGAAVGAYPPGLVERLKAQGAEAYMGEPPAAAR